VKINLLLTTVSICLLAQASFAETTIDVGNRTAYAANLGWIDWRGDTNNGAVIGEYVCAGYLYSANAGWIHLGSNAPADGIRYQNNAATDYGVNHDGLGHLRGYAYGANIGWINFETNGNPRVDLKTGALSGYVYSANCGWLSLSNAFAHVKTDAVQPGTDSDGDGITDAWELGYTNTLTAFSASSDTDGDGMNDLAEHHADTSPVDLNDVLRITAYLPSFVEGSETNALTWTSKETRCYRLEYRTNLNAGFSWVPVAAVISPDPGSETTRLLSVAPVSLQRYLRVEAFKPLAP
jgi:hypothetical protein